MDDTIRSFPGGIDAEIQSDQVHLTEGQKQLMAMARVLLENRNVVVLDEVRLVWISSTKTDTPSLGNCGS